MTRAAQKQTYGAKKPAPPKKTRGPRVPKVDPAKKESVPIIAPDEPGGATLNPDKLREVLSSLALRKGGAAYHIIAQNLGITEATAQKNVTSEMRRLRERIREESLDHLQLQLERLNELLMSYWPRRADPKFGAMILSVMNKMDALLGIQSEKIDLRVEKSALEQLPEDALDGFLSKFVTALREPTPVKRG